MVGRFQKGNILGRKYEIDSNAFAIINSEEQAYFLGLLMADGSLGKYGNDYSIRLSINKKDDELLLNFGKFLKTTKPIYYDKRGAATLHISNRIIFTDLCELGCTPRKSLTLKFPIIDDQNIHHFIRGYFDGDGCITFDSQKIRQCSISIISSYDFILKLNEVLKAKTGLFVKTLPKYIAKKNKGYYSTWLKNGGAK